MTTNQDKKIQPFYCKPASRDEELEIAERLLVNGVGFDGWHSAEERLNSIRVEPGFCFIGVNSTGNLNRWKEHYDFLGKNELTIQQVRELYPHLEYDTKEDQTIYVTENKQEFVPSVGQECEARFGLGEWLKVKIIHRRDSDNFACLLLDNRVLHGTDLLWSRTFRPLKTEAEIRREKAVEEMKSVFDKTVCLPQDVIFETLVDSGYIKRREISREEILEIGDKYFKGTSADLHDVLLFAREIQKHIKGEA